MKVNIRLGGVPDLTATLSRMADTEGLADALEDAAGQVRHAAIARLTDGQPPDNRTGTLAKSLTVTREISGLGFTLSTPLDHGWHLEHGGLQRPATPWLGPALDDARPAIERRLGDWLTRAVRG